MSYKYEKETGDIVIDGWEQGIGSSPFKGLGDIKSGNITTLSSEVSISYNRTRQSQQGVITNSLNADSGSTLLTPAGSNVQSGLLRGTWINIVSSTISSLSTGHYYVLTSSGGVVTLSTDYEGSLVTGLGLTGSASFSLVKMGQPIAWTSDSQNTPFYSYYVLDANGLVWKNPPGAASATTGLGTWSLIDYTPVANPTTTSGLFIYGGYIHAITNSVYWKATGSVAGLGHSTPWAAMQNNSAATISLLDTRHFALVAANNVVYFAGLDSTVTGANSAINSLRNNSGTSYNAGDQSTYTYTPGALLLPGYDQGTIIGQATVQGGITLFIGALSNILYTWTPSTGADTPGALFMAENYTQAMVTVNNLVYIFAGSKGNIYVTNGSSVTVALTIPDYVANSTGGNQDPFYVWGGTMYLRGRIYFSVQAPNCGGIWSFVPTINYYAEQDTGISLRCENQNSYGTYSGVATILIPSLGPTDQQANGPQYYAGWDDGSNGASNTPYAIDFSDTIPALNGMILESDFIPTGTLLKKNTFKQMEYKLVTAPTTTTVTAPLAIGATTATLSSAWVGKNAIQYTLFSSGDIRHVAYVNGSTSISWTGALTKAASPILTLEVVQLRYRTDLNAAFTVPTTLVNFEAGGVSGYFPVDFEKTQWLQIQALVTSAYNGSSTFIPVREIRIR